MEKNSKIIRQLYERLFIEISNNLLEAKHRRAMKESVWLFMWLLDKMTSYDENGIGKVLGGMPINYKKVNEELDVPERTYTDWVERLRNSGYIRTTRTPNGLVFEIFKAKKVFGRRSVPQKTAYRGDTQKKQSDTQKKQSDTQDSRKQYKTVQDNTRQRKENMKNAEIHKQRIREKMGWKRPKVSH